MKRPQALWTRTVILQQSPLVFLSQQAVIISMLVVLIVGPQNPTQKPSDNAVFSEDQPSTLVLLQLLFRHGDRSPIHLFAWDSHTSEWDQGPGQLTQLGMKQAYAYGELLRQRYAGFLPQDYSRFEVKVRSTNFDRTLMTVQCLLVGLFPANISNWAPSVWQPIPVHTQPIAMDHLFARAPCPRLKRLNEEFQSSPESVQFRSKYLPLLSDLTQYTGTKVTHEIARQISDTMFCEKQNGMSRPEWMTEDLFDRLMMLRNDSNSQSFIAAGTARLSAGPLLEEMTKNMELRANDPTSKEKLFLFSAHDDSVASLGRAIGIFNNLQPPYLASIILELHEQDGNFFVKTLFENHTSDSPYTKTIKGCAIMCPVAKFHHLLKDNMLSAADREEACAEGCAPEFFKQNGIPILVGAMMVLSVAAAMIIYKLKRAKHQQRDMESVQYRQLLQDNADNEEEEDDVDEM